MTTHSVYIAQTLRTIRTIPQGWFFCDWTIPENSYLDFVRVDPDGRRVYKRQLDSTTVRFKEGDVGDGYFVPKQCFTAAYM